MNLVRFNSNGANDFFNMFNTNSCEVGTPALASRMVEHDDRYEIVFAVPGMTKEDVSIRLEKSVLTVSGAKNEKALFLKEGFKQSYRIGEKIDMKKIEAKVDNGVLTVALSKKEKAATLSMDIKVN